MAAGVIRELYKFAWSGFLLFAYLPGSAVASLLRREERFWAWWDRRWEWAASWE